MCSALNFIRAKKLFSVPQPLHHGETELKITILSQKQNPLLKRKEIAFEVDHSKEGKTSSRLELRRNLAKMLDTEPDLVFVSKIKTKTGAMTAKGKASAYESTAQAELIEPKHIIARNVPSETPSEEKPKPEEPKVEKPKEEEQPQKKSVAKIEEEAATPEHAEAKKQPEQEPSQKLGSEPKPENIEG